MSRHPVVKRLNKWFRKLHRWGAIAVALPLLVVIGSGLLLQLKKDWWWVQPPTARGVGGNPSLSFDEILETAKGVPEAEIGSWDEVDRLDVRPGRGIVKVRGKNKWEIQIDTTTGEVIHVAFRRSDLIESIHDGSWFHPAAKLWVFLPCGAALLGLYMTGMYLWALPLIAKPAGRRRRAKSGVFPG